MKYLNWLLLRLLGWRLIKPLAPELQAFEIRDGARYLVLADASRVGAATARHLRDSVLPPGSKVLLVDCGGGVTPKDVVQLFEFQS